MRLETLVPPEGWTMDVRNPVGEEPHVYLLPPWAENEPQAFGFQIHKNDDGGARIVGVDLAAGAVDEDTTAITFAKHVVDYVPAGDRFVGVFETDEVRDWFAGIPDDIATTLTEFTGRLLVKWNP